MKYKHCPVFLNIGHKSQPMTVHVCRYTPEGRLGERVSAVVLADYAGNIPEAIKAYDAGDYARGAHILHNLA